MNRIIEGIQHFRRDVFPANRELFERLASGQKPEALFIACSDSRVSLEWITQCAPGDLFVCRNAGNIAPSHSNSDAVSATIEYAVSALRIRHIVVCGHSDCGAMKGLLHPEALDHMPDVRGWLTHAEEARRTLESIGLPEDPAERVSVLAKLNVRVQLNHLMTHPQVRARVQEGSLELHGWFYQIGSGEVSAWEPLGEEWIAVHEAPAFSSARQKVGREARHA